MSSSRHRNIPAKLLDRKAILRIYCHNYLLNPEPVTANTFKEHP
jgi:hypothetical protein